MKTSNAKTLMTGPEIAAELKISPHAIAYLARVGRISPALVTPGGWRLFDVDELKRLREYFAFRRVSKPQQKVKP